MKTFHKCKTVDATNLQSGELIHMDSAFYNVTSIQGLTSILIVLCSKTIMLWLFPTISKRAPTLSASFTSYYQHLRINNTHTNS